MRATSMGYQKAASLMNVLMNLFVYKKKKDTDGGTDQLCIA